MHLNVSFFSQTSRKFPEKKAEIVFMKKSELPEKICITCGRPFAWRKKWARCWEEVRYCSDRCRRARHTRGDAAALRR